jgi:serine protease
MTRHSKENAMSISGKSVRNTALLLACALAACGTEPTRYENPYSPQTGHQYRYGVVPTRECADQMSQWESAHPYGAPMSDTVAYGGGVDGVGVTSGVPRVYLVFYGSQWAQGGSGDPSGVSTFLQAFFTGIGTGEERWSGTVTQYCDGPTVPKGATRCDPASTPHVGYPKQGALAGVWFDTAAPSPANATAADLSQEAVNAAAHFGNTSPGANRYAQYFIISPTGTHPDGFGLSGQNFCGWHYYVRSPFGDIAYSNLPYVSDAGRGCGVKFLNSGEQGVLDAFSLVAAHEYAETLTDQFPPGGWTNPVSGEEVADPCAWISSGPGHARNVKLSTGTFALQSLWSNDTSSCEVSHAIR